MLVETASAQYWCPQGAEWHHEYFVGMTQVVGYVITTYTGDSLIGGRTAQRLQRYVHTYSPITQNYNVSGPGVIYTSVDNDLVEQWNGSSYDTLFHFGAEPGGHWQLPGSSLITITVLDTGHVVKAGASLRYLVMDLGPFSNVPNGVDTLFERLGFKGAYIDVYSAFASDGDLGALRCYSDVDLAVTPDSIACDFILSLDDSGRRATVSLHPNPAGTSTTILFSSAATRELTLVLRDPLGRLVHTERLPPGQTAHSLALADLPEGVYVISVEGTAAPFAAARLVVSR